MDPWAEAEWLRRFPRLAAGRTVVVITHRLTTAAVAERIYVMDGGRVVEAGRHEELLALGGRYAESWQAQRQEVQAAPQRVIATVDSLGTIGAELVRGDPNGTFGSQQPGVDGARDVEPPT
jgi:ABC-type multidrug transport system ATPase subunit